MEENFKAGFVNIIGNPNVGKSTLMNSFLGTKLSIITPKVQTTRHRILGILNGENYQIVFSDTPGILDPKYEMQKRMLNYVFSAIEDADLLLYLTDIDDMKKVNEEVIKRINKLPIPVLLVINKIDIHKQPEIESAAAIWKKLLPNAEIHKISALRGDNVTELRDRIIELLPVHPPYYDDAEYISDKTERFFVSEIIREKIFLNYRQEIPYSVDVQIEEFKEKEDITVIRAIIYVNHRTQKSILIGRNGEAIKKVGIQAREEIEMFLGKKVFLELRVKVKENWRNDPNTLRRFGYVE
jgi:GTP-binding protein Era